MSGEKAVLHNHEVQHCLILFVFEDRLLFFSRCRVPSPNLRVGSRPDCFAGLFVSDSLVALAPGNKRPTVRCKLQSGYLSRMCLANNNRVFSHLNIPDADGASDRRSQMRAVG